MNQAADTRSLISILIVDDHPALRAGLRQLLDGEADMEVVGDVSCGEEAYAWYRGHHPDVVVMDLSMAGYGGVESLRRILRYDSLARVLIYTVHDSDVMLSRALRQGALGYVTKGSDIDSLLEGIRSVAGRRGFVSRDMVPALVREHANPDQALVDQLSHREFQILLLIAQGQRVAECAATLSLSEKTVRNHLTQIKVKLNVGDSAELIRLAIRAGVAQA